MELICIGSSSKGNGYILRGKDESLIIECGVRLEDAKISLDYDVSSVRCALVSHRHGDHAGHIDEYAKVFHVMCPDDVKSAHDSDRIHAVNPYLTYKVGGFRVIPFPVEHDVPCYGYMIAHDEMGTLLFVTDAPDIPVDISLANHIMVECNYDIKSMSAAVAEGRTSMDRWERLQASHMSLETVISNLTTKDISLCRDIVLLHLSDSNSNEGYCVQKVMGATALPVYAADKGMIVQLNNY